MVQRPARDQRTPICVAALLLSFLGACADGTSSGSDDEAQLPQPSEERATSTTPTGYCADLRALTHVLDSGGSETEYNELLSRVVDEAPSDHAHTWALMLKLSTDEFTYENFNPALDSLDDIDVDLNLTCPSLDDPRMIVDDNGRLRQWLED